MTGEEEKYHKTFLRTLTVCGLPIFKQDGRTALAKNPGMFPQSSRFTHARAQHVQNSYKVYPYGQNPKTDQQN